MNYQQRLRDLYESKWDELYNELVQIDGDPMLTIKATNPLLLSVKDESLYSSADIKVMIFGQETNGWHEEDDNVEGIMSGYDRFYNTGYCYSYGGQFWNGYNRFLSLLKNKFQGKKIEAVWNDIIKIGKSNAKGTPPDYIYQVEQSKFNVIKNEIEILKPDLVLFLCGHGYDSYIRNNFEILGLTGIEPFNSNQLASMKIEGINLCFRTYHPGYLWRNDIDKYYHAIIENL